MATKATDATKTRSPFKVTSGATTYFIKGGLNKVAYKDVDQSLGITWAEAPDANDKPISLSGAIELGVLIKLKASVTTGGRNSSATLICPLSKAEEAIGGTLLAGKKFGVKQGTINSVRVRRVRIFS